MSEVISGHLDTSLSPRLRERLDSLRVTMVGVCVDGSVKILGGSTWLERMLLHAAPFKAALARRMEELSCASGHAVEVWPGVHLATLPVRRRRRLVAQGSEPVVHAAVFLCRELIDSEQFHTLCSAQQLDYQITKSQVSSAHFVSPEEVTRLAQMIAWMQDDAQQLDRRTGELQTMSHQLGDTYEELSLLYKLSTNMAVDQPPEHFLTEACREMQQVLGLKWLALQLTDTDARLNKLSGKTFVAGDASVDPQAFTRIGARLMADHPVGSTPRVVDHVCTLRVPGLSQLTEEMLMLSLMRENKPLGLLFGGDKLDGSHISSIDSKLCSSMVSSMSIFLENMMLYEDMHAMFMGTLHALTNSIDAKDNYTHGHSERVALMSRMLAEAAGLDAHQVERVYIAGLVHDVGKIGVPESVLCKPGRLTEDEFGLIKLHPEIGARILQDIRQMQDLIPGVLYHHERWDGRGYPHNLAGSEIPLFGRVIGLADSFDAMSSNRTYRQALAHEQVINEISRCAGSQFDPELAKVFVKLDFTPFFQLIQKHQRLAAPVMVPKPAKISPDDSTEAAS